MPEKKVRFAEFELDCTRFRLFRNGEAVRLEGIPLQLLIFLVEHPCELISREQIAEALWGNGVFVDVETSINTAVRKVRIALDDDSALPKYLQTVVGRGYRFVADVEPSEIPQSEYSFSAEEFGRAVIAAAGISPRNPRRADNHGETTESTALRKRVRSRAEGDQSPGYSH